jgi:hypothetical protein
VYAPTEDKYDDTKNIFYGELEHVFDQFPKHCINILLGDFNTQVGREDIFKMTVGNESLQNPSQTNGDKMGNLRCDANGTFRTKKGIFERQY